MDKFKFEIPTKEREQDAIDFINEFYEYNSDINGTGGLQRYDYKRIPNEEKVPAKTYFLVRESDNRIVGMINIRLALNERLKKYGGHIGYCIRPTERGKGYNKINLYLGLKICKEHEIKEVFMDADKENPASWKTMESLGGKNIREYYDDEYAHCVVKDYTINVDNAIEENRKKYEHLLSDNIITQKL